MLSHFLMTDIVLMFKFFLDHEDLSVFLNINDIILVFSVGKEQFVLWGARDTWDVGLEAGLGGQSNG